MSINPFKQCVLDLSMNTLNNQTSDLDFYIFTPFWRDVFFSSRLTTNTFKKGGWKYVCIRLYIHNLYVYYKRTHVKTFHQKKVTVNDKEMSFESLFNVAISYFWRSRLAGYPYLISHKTTASEMQWKVFTPIRNQKRHFIAKFDQQGVAFKHNNPLPH